MNIIDTNLLDLVTEKAIRSTRLRMNHNFHKTLDAKAQCLLNALEPETKLPIHRHRNTDETYLLIRGSMNVFYYNSKKEIIESALLKPTEGKFGINIPAGQWHTIESLESGTVILEVKEGPYSTLDDEDILK